jgi:hypothetical protein
MFRGELRVSKKNVGGEKLGSETTPGGKVISQKAALGTPPEPPISSFLTNSWPLQMAKWLASSFLF